VDEFKAKTDYDQQYLQYMYNQAAWLQQSFYLENKEEDKRVKEKLVDYKAKLKDLLEDMYEKSEDPATLQKQEDKMEKLEAKLENLTKQMKDATTCKNGTCSLPPPAPEKPKEFKPDDAEAKAKAAEEKEDEAKAQEAKALEAKTAEAVAAEAAAKKAAEEAKRIRFTSLPRALTTKATAVAAVEEAQRDLAAVKHDVVVVGRSLATQTGESSKVVLAKNLDMGNALFAAIKSSHEKALSLFEQVVDLSKPKGGQRNVGQAKGGQRNVGQAKGGRNKKWKGGSALDDIHESIDLLKVIYAEFERKQTSFLKADNVASSTSKLQDLVEIEKDYASKNKVFTDKVMEYLLSAKLAPAAPPSKAETQAAAKDLQDEAAAVTNLAAEEAKRAEEEAEKANRAAEEAALQQRQAAEEATLLEEAKQAAVNATIKAEEAENQPYETYSTEKRKKTEKRKATKRTTRSETMLGLYENSEGRRRSMRIKNKR